MTPTERTVALFRGINVGRAKRIRMEDLRHVLEDLGLTEVRTLLQSGNAVFAAPAGHSVSAIQISDAVAGITGVRSTVILRTVAELRAALQSPFAGIATDPSRHFVGFIEEEVDPGMAADLNQLALLPDQLRVSGHHCHLWCPAGLLGGPSARAGWERRLGSPVTLRNWTTAGRLLALAEAE